MIDGGRRGTRGEVRTTVVAGVIAVALTGGTAHAQEPPATLLELSKSFTSEPFTRVRGVQELPDGRVLVVDQTEEALYRIDFATGERVKLGRNGEGPGEYKSPTGLHPFRGDSVMMDDIENGRLAIMDYDGRIARFEPMFGSVVSIPAWADDFGNRYWDGVSGVRIANRNDPSAPDEAPVVRYGYETEAADTLAFLTVPHPPGLTEFPAWDEWGVAPDGWVAVVRNQDEYRLDWVAPDGRVRRGPPVEGYRALRVSDADVEALEEDRSAGGGGGGFIVAGGDEAPRRPPLRDIPDRFPPARLGGVWPTYDGRALVERHQHLADRAEGERLDVFDRSGRRVAVFRLPPDRIPVGVGPSGLFTIREDDVGFLWLELYGLPGGG